VFAHVVVSARGAGSGRTQSVTMPAAAPNLPL
jgi:hypothetical protein